MAARGNIFPICPQLGDGQNHKKYQETLNLSKGILKTKMVPQSGDLLKRSFKNGGDLSGRKRRHRHCVFKAYNEALVGVQKPFEILRSLCFESSESRRSKRHLMFQKLPKCFFTLGLGL